jgi:hypothetical protein
MWSNWEFCVACGLCFIAGILATVFFLAMGENSQESKRREEEKERNDPANWWKHGGDPFS